MSNLRIIFNVLGCPNKFLCKTQTPSNYPTYKPSSNRLNICLQLSPVKRNVRVVAELYDPEPADSPRKTIDMNQPKPTNLSLLLSHTRSFLVVLRTALQSRDYQLRNRTRACKCYNNVPIAKTGLKLVLNNYY